MYFRSGYVHGARRPHAWLTPAHSTKIASFCPFAVAPGPRRILGAFHLENKAPADAEARPCLHTILSHAEL
jgi:hypothetical protein